MFKWLLDKLSNLIDAIWTPFNRDTLRNACLPYVYNTYNPYNVKPGDIFCHVDDRTQQRWIRLGLALIVTQVFGPRELELTTRFNVVDPHGNDPVPVPIRVTTLQAQSVKVDDVFTAYGQYSYDGVVNGQMTFRQINDVNEHVFKEPFISVG